MYLMILTWRSASPRKAGLARFVYADNESRTASFVDTTLDSVIPGIYDYKLPLISAERFWAAYKANGGFNVVWSPDDYNRNTVSGTEKVASGYALANMNFGDLSRIGERIP